ncbi:MAG: DMT family transporter [Thermoflexales bacterium]|nr:DMT family transporter [Thermoflexales bacterium]MDW8352401.1 DMT family transporter [Anaerolineae bacterium]
MDNLLGLLFVFLWASASTAAKYGFQSQPPLTVLSLRFAIAAAMMLVWSYGIRRNTALPRGHQWGQLAIVGLTNSTLFLGAAWLSLREVTVGLYSLFLATMPFLVAVLSLVWLGRRVTAQEWLGIAVAAVGLIIVAAPSLANSAATWRGLALLVVAMLSQAIGSVYLKWTALTLPSGVINTWQLVLGLIFLLPFAAALNGDAVLQVTPQLVGGLAWSVLMVSVIANALMFTLQKRDPLRASVWLLLAPVFSYLQAALVLGEPIRPFDVVGAALVMAGLAISGAMTVRPLAGVPKRRTADQVAPPPR